MSQLNDAPNPANTADAGVVPPDTPWLMDAGSSATLARRYGIPHPDQTICDNPEEAAAASELIGLPVVLKALGPSIVHKSDVGGLRLNLGDSAEVKVAAADLLGSVPGATQVLVQSMARAGVVEMIVGAKRDPVFGPLVMVGLGGIWAEMLDDVRIQLAPVTAEDTRTMLDSLRAAEILRGTRGSGRIDVEGLIDVVVAASRMIAENDHIAEIDFNPVICDVDRIEVVDLRIIERVPAAEDRSQGHGGFASLDALLNPQSVVVIGASRNPNKQGGRLLSYLIKHGYAGELTVVNPNASEVMGCRAVPTVAALDAPADLACISVPAESVVETVEACGKAGVKAAIVFGAGFSEVGDAEGVSRQEELMAVSRRYGIRICGPNTAGIVSRPAHLCASMGMAFEVGNGELPVGSTALVTQSGAIGGSLLSRLRESGVGFSYWISAGNESDLTLGDYVNWLVDEPSTKTIVLFIEAVRDTEAFTAACERARTNGKAVIAYKTGRSEAGQAAVQSHTAALAGDQQVYEAAFERLGVIQVHNLQALIDVAIALDWQPAPRGRRIGVVSASGGACSVVADECDRMDLELPRLSPGTRARVEEVIPSFGRSENPVDVTMQINITPSMVGQVAKAMLDDEGLDGVLVMMTSNAGAPAVEVARGVIAASRASDKPVIVARMGAEELAPESLRLYREARIPVFPMPDRAVASLAFGARFGGRLISNNGCKEHP